MTAAMDILYMQDPARSLSNHSSDNNIATSMPSSLGRTGSARHVSFDGDIPSMDSVYPSGTNSAINNNSGVVSGLSSNISNSIVSSSAPHTTSTGVVKAQESMLATIWEQQAKRKKSSSAGHSLVESAQVLFSLYFYLF